MAVSSSISTVTGLELVTLGNTRVGEAYVFGALVPKNDPAYHGPWDCAEFVSWIIFQNTGKLYGCANDAGRPATADAFTGYFDRDARKIGNIVSIQEAASTPGALLLRSAVPKLTGHIVVCDGLGGTVEAHSHADGVIKSKVANRRWDLGILIPGVSYNALPMVPVPVPQETVFHVTVPAMVSEKVGDIQKALKNAGFDPGRIDNKYGRKTARAVIGFQQKNNLLVDGEVGEQTARALGIRL